MSATASAVASVPSKRRRIKSESVPPATTSSNTDFMAATTSALQHRADIAAPLAVSDLNIAFDLQMQEAIAASRDFAAAQDIARLEQPRKADIIEIPDEEGESAIRDCDLGFNEYFCLYSKGLVVEDRNKAKLGAIGVAIFNSSNAVVFETSKPLVFPEAEMRDEVAELEAFVEGLELALNLQIKIVMCGCLDSNLYSYLCENQKPKDAKVAELVKRAFDLIKRFMGCHLSLYKTNAQHVLQLARSSIEKQAGKPFLTKVNCPICLEDVDSERMFKTCHRRRHHFCFSCIQKHVKSKVRGRELPQCPQPNCLRKLSYDVCKKFLAPKMYDMFDQLFKEASIPASDKLYCPNPMCSNLMSKTEALANIRSVASTSKVKGTACSMCVKCRSLFCINCRVMWHSNMSCGTYKKRELDNLNAADVNLKMLARMKKWRQCPSCSHMIELALGCNHISCRCGHEFCYKCGSEWKKKKATCSCVFWSEENIILRRSGHRQ